MATPFDSAVSPVCPSFASILGISGASLHQARFEFPSKGTVLRLPECNDLRYGLQIEISNYRNLVAIVGEFIPLATVVFGTLQQANDIVAFAIECDGGHDRLGSIVLRDESCHNLFPSRTNRGGENSDEAKVHVQSRHRGLISPRTAGDRKIHWLQLGGVMQHGAEGVVIRRLVLRLVTYAGLLHQCANYLFTFRLLRRQEIHSIGERSAAILQSMTRLREEVIEIVLAFFTFTHRGTPKTSLSVMNFEAFVGGTAVPMLDFAQSFAVIDHPAALALEPPMVAPLLLEVSTLPLAVDSLLTSNSIPLINLLPQFVRLVQSNDRESQGHGAAMIERLLRENSGPSIQALFDTATAATLVEFLARGDDVGLQCNVLRIFSYIASNGSLQHVQKLMALHPLPFILDALLSTVADCRKLAALVVEKLAGKNVKLRDALVAQGCLCSLMNIIQAPGECIGAIRGAVAGVSALLKHKPSPAPTVWASLVPLLVQLLSHADPTVALEALTAIRFASDGAIDRIQVVLDAGALPPVVELLSSSRAILVAEAVQIVGNVSTGCDLQADQLLQANILPVLRTLLCSPCSNIRQHVCWTVSNIVAGNHAHIQAVIDANLFPLVFQCISDRTANVRRDAIWAVANAASGGTPDQAEYLITAGVFVHLGHALRSGNDREIAVALEAVETLLQCEKCLAGGTSENKDMSCSAAVGLGEIIRTLQQHSNPDISAQALDVEKAYLREVVATESTVTAGLQS